MSHQEEERQLRRVLDMVSRIPLLSKARIDAMKIDELKALQKRSVEEISEIKTRIHILVLRRKRDNRES